ncbi:ABC transporter permease [soil metagenome]
MTLAVLAVAVLADVIAPFDPLLPVGPSLSPPSIVYLMGTDDLGRDLFSGVIHGTRTSTIIALGVGAIALVIGTLVGTVAGQRGGLVDDVLMRITEFFQVLPRFFVAVLAVALFGAGLDRLVLVLGLTSWPILARVIRAEVLSLRTRGFVEAAVALGASDLQILRRAILPNAMSPVIVFLTLLLGQVLLLEASLGFLGLSDPNAISWGYLANQAQRFLRIAWWMWLFPGAAIMIAVLALNLLGDALTRDTSGRT